MPIDYLSVTLWDIPPWASRLNNAYWRLRQVRHEKDRRLWYRRIEVEKVLVLESGVDSELVRLACRYFKNPRDVARLRRIQAREAFLVSDVELFTGRQVWASGSFDE
jgi:hypothetical protein